MSAMENRNDENHPLPPRENPDKSNLPSGEAGSGGDGPGTSPPTEKPQFVPGENPRPSTPDHGFIEPTGGGSAGATGGTWGAS